MTEKQWAEKIKINKDCFETIEKNRPSDRLINQLNILFWYDTSEFNRELATGDFSHSQILSLLFYIAYDKRINAENTDIFDDTMQDLMLWAEECYKHHGYYGLSEMLYIWIGMLIKGDVVRFGRLEFEKGVMPETVSVKGKTVKEGEPVIHVHIPAGEPLLYEECVKSYNKCLEYFGLNNAVFLCDSWLLSPVLCEILSENSNIMKFQKDFYIYKTDMLGRMFEERVFGWCIYDNPMLYRAETSLQKKAKNLLRHGKSLPGAWGVLLWEKM